MSDTSTVDDAAGKRQVAKHGLLDQAGNLLAESSDFENAHGIRYLDIATGQTFDYMLTNPESVRMFAAFGARTLTTNEASQVRNSKEGGTPAEQVQAIRDRFALIDSGTWVDRSREGGPRWDVPTLASAAVAVAVAKKKVPNTDAAKGDAYDKFLKLMTEDPSKVTVIRAVEGVEAEYRKLRGTAPSKTVDDLMSLVTPAAVAAK
jgi:hypothetical protein